MDGPRGGSDGWTAARRLLLVAAGPGPHEKPSQHGSHPPGRLPDGEADRWRRRDAEEIAAEATRLLDQLESWQERIAEERPELAETRRIDYLNAKLALQAARSGSFATAAGPLNDFLKSVGTPAERLDIH